MKEHVGRFAEYPEDDKLELVGFSNCRVCPGGNIEYVPEEMIELCRPLMTEKKEIMELYN